MLQLYRNVWIVLLQDGQLTAELTEAGSGEPLPTKVVASKDEGVNVCLNRARELVDRYRGDSRDPTD